MEKYVSTSGKQSGVVGYEMGSDYIKVKFVGGRTYTYRSSMNSSGVIERMKALALQSRGLSTYIAQNKSTLKFS